LVIFFFYKIVVLLWMKFLCDNVWAKHALPVREVQIIFVTLICAWLSLAVYYYLLKMKKDNTPKVYCTYQKAPKHRFPNHPESPQRITTLGAWLDFPPYPEMEWLPYEPAREGEVTLAHRQSLLAAIKAESQQGTHEFEPAPTYVTATSYQDALGAAGATLAVSRRIVEEGQGRGFAIVRPPGHHAEPDRAMGFCLLNNIAIAAADAVASGLEKVAIVDFDAHQGNGTQAIFWDTPQVGYFSTHEGGSYPGSGRLDEAPHARGRIINCPLPAFAGNAAFRRVLDEVMEPWIRQFKPEMIFVSAGFDAHFSDPLTTLTLDTKGYYMLAQRLVSFADHYARGRIMFVLEGGYDPKALEDNIQACLAAMCERSEYSDHYGEAPGVSPNVDSLISKLRETHHLKE
jgi:acetoin utilization deacetylase AcuC-like enzyme